MIALEIFLQEQGIEYSIFTDSVPIRSAQEGAQLYNIALCAATPTLILKVDDQYYAAIICGDRRISFDKLKEALHARSVSLADPKTVFSLTGAKIGDVSMINRGLPTLIDIHVLNNAHCYGGCGITGKTLKMRPADLARITQGIVLDFC